MAIKFLILSLLLIGCGREVKIPNNLATASQLNESDLKKFEKNGTLFKGNPDHIQYNGTNYKVSIYSSQSSLSFINAIPDNLQVPVVFVGGINQTDVVLETIRKK